MKTSFVMAALAATAAASVMTPAHAGSAADTAKLSTHKLSIGMFPALRPLALVRAEHWLEDAGYDGMRASARQSATRTGAQATPDPKLPEYDK